MGFIRSILEYFIKWTVKVSQAVETQRGYDGMRVI